MANGCGNRSKNVDDAQSSLTFSAAKSSNKDRKLLSKHYIFCRLTSSSLGAVWSVFATLLVVLYLKLTKPLSSSSLLRSEVAVNTDAFDHLDTFFELKNDDREWRLIASRPKRTAPAPAVGHHHHHHHRTLFDCQAVEQLLMAGSVEFVASGWTKAVYKAAGGRYAVKTVDMTGQHVSQCLDESATMIAGDSHVDNNRLLDVCYAKAAKKIIKEIAFLSQIPHPNVIKVFGYCVPKNFHSDPNERRVTIVTELGQPVNLITLLQLSWEDRLRVVLSLTKLLKFLSSHRLGSIIMNDMRRQQFVLVDGQLKLVDVDDLGLEEPRCTDDVTCSNLTSRLRGMLDDDGNSSGGDVRSSNFSEPSHSASKCINGTCRGFNEFKNVYNAARHFTTFLLPYGAPPQLQSLVVDLVDEFRKQIPVDILLRNTLNIRDVYANGSYLSLGEDEILKNNASFKRIVNGDLNALHDYPCRGSSSFASCTLSVANIQEAQTLCRSQPVCKAFEWTNETSWTGRNIVHFKNDSSSWSISDQNATVLYIKATV